MFKLHDITQGHPLLAVTYTILQVMTNVITFFHKYFVAKFCLFKDLFPVRSAIVECSSPQDHFTNLFLIFCIPFIALSIIFQLYFYAKSMVYNRGQDLKWL